MNVLRIVADGFLSHRHTDFAPNGARLVTLVGPNGAGKSGLASDAIAYALHDNARGRTDDLVQLGASNMSVTVEFELGGSIFRVVRGRSTRAGGKTFLELHVADSDNPGVHADRGWRPLTAGSIRETQQLLDDLLRMDAATFTATALLQQGRLTALLDATPKERKRVLASVVVPPVFEPAEAEARTRLRDAESESAVLADRLERLETQLADREGLEAVLETARTEAQAVTTDRAGVDEQLAARRADLVTVVEQLATAAAAGDEIKLLTDAVDQQAARWRTAQHTRRTAVDAIARADATLAQADTIRDAVTRVPALEAELAAARDAVEAFRVLERDWEQAAQARREAERDAEAATVRHEQLVGQLGDTTVCPECGATIPAGGEALKARIAEAEATMRARTDEIEALPPATDRPVAPTADPWTIQQSLSQLQALAAAEPSLAEAERVKAQATTAIATADAESAAAEEDGKQARAALEAARKKHANLGPLREQRTALESGIAQLERSAVELSARAHGLAGSIAQAEASLERIARLADEHDAVDEQRDLLLIQAELLRQLVVAFGVNGIPPRIIESVLPELGAHANEVLAQLRPGMVVELRAQRAKKSGDGMIEALDLVVRDDAGERPLALFSGGERMSVALALAVGLSRLVARRSGSAIRTLVIDEPDGLDVDARRAFGQSLRLLAHNGELERVLLVSHHEDLAEFGDATYRVTKGPQGSVVTEVS